MTMLYLALILPFAAELPFLAAASQKESLRGPVLDVASPLAQAPAAGHGEALKGHEVAPHAIKDWPAEAPEPKLKGALELAGTAGSAGQRGQAGAKPKEDDCYFLLGLTKFSWAMLCDMLALVVVLLCIPLLLTCSKRRNPGAPMFDFGKVCGPEDGTFSFKGAFGQERQSVPPAPTAGKSPFNEALEPGPFFFEAELGMAFRIAFVASLALAAAEFASPVGKVVSLLGEIQGKIEEEGKAEDVKIAEYKAVCERRKSDLGYQIKTAKSDIEELRP
eukprot:s3585_g8.t1